MVGRAARADHRERGVDQHIEEIPAEIRAVYGTVWEISQKTLIDLAADRGAFICQSQSFSLYMADPTDQQLTSALTYAWQKGSRPGCTTSAQARGGAAAGHRGPRAGGGLQPREPGDCVMCSS